MSRAFDDYYRRCHLDHGLLRSLPAWANKRLEVLLRRAFEAGRKYEKATHSSKIGRKRALLAENERYHKALEAARALGMSDE